MIQLFIHLIEGLDSGDRSHIELPQITMGIIGWFNYLTFTDLKYFRKKKLLPENSLKNPEEEKKCCLKPKHSIQRKRNTYTPQLK